jgi:hypothetical protein
VLRTAVCCSFDTLLAVDASVACSSRSLARMGEAAATLRRGEADALAPVSNVHVCTVCVYILVCMYLDLHACQPGGCAARCAGVYAGTDRTGAGRA